MSAATAAAPNGPRSAREAVQQTLGGTLEPGLNLSQPHYFVQFGWERMDVDTNAIPNRYLLRGEITPCVSYAQKSNLVEIREGELIPGSQEADKDGREVYGKYWRHAHFEAERLRNNEVATDARQGLVEIEDPDGFLDRLYKNLDLNAIFFPQGLHALPVENKALIEHLKARRDALETEQVPTMPEHFRPILLNVADQMVAAAEVADQIQRKRLEWTHTCMKLTPEDRSGNFKREYDKVDEEMLARTKTPRVHSADITTAQALDKLATPREDKSLAMLVELQAQQLEMQIQQAARDSEQKAELQAQNARLLALFERLTPLLTAEAAKPAEKPTPTPAKK
jgi:hypothetical protein